MSFTDAISTCLRKYFTFSGRARRSEYWWFVLFVVLGSLLMWLLDGFFFSGGAAPGTAATPPAPLAPNTTVTDPDRGPLQSLWGLAVFFPMLAAAWRRLHDSGRPGWYVLLPTLFSILSFAGLMLGVVSFAALSNVTPDPEVLRGPAAWLGVSGLIIVLIVQAALAILMLYWLTRPSDPGTNRFGPQPAPGL